MPPELQEAQALGISLFAGEAEGRLEQVLRDAWNGTLKPLYNYMDDLPSLEGAPSPMLPATRIKRTAGGHPSFDAGRGCPFQCSFCTIINVQGRKSRRRSADDIEQIDPRAMSRRASTASSSPTTISRATRIGKRSSTASSSCARGEGMDIKFIIQVDTLCHRIPNFIEKAGRAGVARVFIGLESINPDSLLAAKKRQNKITEYRKMLLDWKSGRRHDLCRLHSGLPDRHAESIVRDIEIIKRELPIDLLEFFCLTPLPGSEDHQTLFLKGVRARSRSQQIRPRACHHRPRQDVERGMGARLPPGLGNLLFARAHGNRDAPRRGDRHQRRQDAVPAAVVLWLHHHRERSIRSKGGYFRRKYRKRPAPHLAARKSADLLSALCRRDRLEALCTWHASFSKFGRIRRAINAIRTRAAYMDQAMTPVIEDELEALEMFTVNEAAKAAVTKARREEQARAAAPSA